MAGRDAFLGSAIALGMAALFIIGSPGRALIVTFVPGVFAAWIAYLYLGLRAAPLPTVDRLLPVFGTSLAVQLLHFAEEFGTGFQTRFPMLYGGEPIADVVFVTFNMVSYAVFLGAALAVTFGRLRPLLVPVLFFAVYGVMGNAVSHLTWVVLAQGYFPGLFTSLLYWLLAPLLLSRLGFAGREVIVIIGCFAVGLVITVVWGLDAGAFGAARAIS